MSSKEHKRLYTPKHKLHNKREYQRVLGEKPLLRTRFFTLHAIPNGCPHGRLGITVGKKVCPLAVWRGKIKRQIRESFRLNQSHLTGLDIVVRVRQPFSGDGLRKGRTFLDQYWETCWTYVKKTRIGRHSGV